MSKSEGTVMPQRVPLLLHRQISIWFDVKLSEHYKVEPRVFGASSVNAHRLSLFTQYNQYYTQF